MQKFRSMRIVGCILLLILVAGFAVACGSQQVVKSTGSEDDNGTAVADAASPQCLFSVSYGGGYGTIEDTATTTWTVYADGTVDSCKLNSRTPAVRLSTEDFEKLLSMVTREKMESLEVEEDWNVMDGGSSYITLYDDNGEVLIKKGGYMCKTEEYTQLRWEILEILRPYIEKFL